MPYVTKYKDVEVTKELGYDRIPLHRPKFIYFEFVGLRPSAPHWLYFGKKEMTKFANTSYTKSDYKDAARDSVLKEPGERFISATQFPSGGGLPYGGATAQGGASDPLFSSANGILKGVFYIQSNDTVRFSLNEVGTELLAIDVLAGGNRKFQAYSYASVKFKGMGQYENYWKGTEKQAYEVWEEPPRTVNTGGGGGGGSKYYVNANGTITSGVQIGTYTGQSGSTGTTGFSSFHEAAHAKNQANRNPKLPSGTIKIGNWAWSPSTGRFDPNDDKYN